MLQRRLRTGLFAGASAILSLLSSIAFAGPSEDEVRKLMQQLRADAAAGDEQRVTGLHGSFLNPSTSEDRRLVSLALGAHYLATNHRLALQYLSSAELASQENDPLLPVIHFYMAEAHYKGGAFKQAAETATRLLESGLGDAWNKRISTLLIESLHAAGENEKMVAAFHEYSKRFNFSRRQESLARLAVEAFERQGDTKRMIDVLEDLARAYPTTAASRWSFQKLTDLSCAKAGHRPRYTFSRRLLLTLSRNLVLDPGLRGFVVAMSDQPLTLEDGTVRRLSDAERADFLFRARLYEEALVATRELHERERMKPESKILPQIVIELGRIHLRLQEHMLAAREFSRYLADYPKSQHTARVNELLADSLKYVGLPLIAAERYAMAGTVRNTRYLKWQRFWNTYRGGDYAGALKLIETSGAVEPRDGDDPQTVEYWHGRVLERLGRKDAAKAVYHTLLARGGDSFYANLVAARFPTYVKDAPKVVAAVATDAPRGLAAKILADGPEADTLPTRPELKLVDDLLKVGMKETATTMLSGLQWNQYSQLDAFAAVSRLALVLDDYQPSRRIRYSGFSALRTLPQSFGDYVDHQIANADDWKIYYPQAFDHLAQPVTDRIGLDKKFLLSIMRTESFYNREARSPVGAVGLMQIMPYTALKIARLLDDEAFEVESLSEPQTSITYGAYYLDRLLRHYGGNPYVAAAAYNGGPAATNSWLDACTDCAADEFVESIAYRETRRYVRQVMTSFAQYARIYDGKRTLPELPKLPVHLPEGEEMF